FFLTRSPDRCTSPLSLHDALPISYVTRSIRMTPSLLARWSASKGAAVFSSHRKPRVMAFTLRGRCSECVRGRLPLPETLRDELRSEEHTSEVQSPDHLVCRVLLET